MMYVCIYAHDSILNIKVPMHHDGSHSTIVHVDTPQYELNKKKKSLKPYYLLAPCTHFFLLPMAFLTPIPSSILQSILFLINEMH